MSSLPSACHAVQGGRIEEEGSQYWSWRDCLDWAGPFRVSPEASVCRSAGYSDEGSSAAISEWHPHHC